MRPLVSFYFEFGSPYSYLASLEIDKRVAAAGGDVDWKPVEIFRIWESQGILDAYMKIRSTKIPYIRRDAQRCASQLDIRLNPPASIANDTRLAKLAYWGLRAAGDERARPFLRQIWHAHFREAQSITDAEDLAIAAASLGLTRADIEALAASEAAAQAQDAANQDAIAVGCFGIPWMECAGESFFGHDRIDQLLARVTRKAKTDEAATAA